MLLFNRRHMLAAFAALAGCGFTPVYGPNGTGRALYGRVAFRAPATVEGFRLRARLEDRLGRVERGVYLLTVDLSVEEVALVITTAQDVNRYNLPGRARWVLTPDGSDQPVAQGEVNTFTAYSAFGTTVATREAQDDARDRLALALADLIVTDLMAAAARLP